MSKLAEFRRAERELQKQMALLEQLQADASLQREMEFEEKLKSLMTDYGVDLAKVVAILDPQPVELESPAPVAVKTRRPRKVYVQPVSASRPKGRTTPCSRPGRLSSGLRWWRDGCSLELPRTDIPDGGTRDPGLGTESPQLSFVVIWPVIGSAAVVPSDVIH